MALPVLQFICWFIGYLLSLLSFLIFRGVALLIVAIIHLLKLPTQASTTVFDAAGNLFRSLFEYAVGIVMELAVAVMSALFQGLRGVVAGSVELTSAAAAELLEKTRSGIGDLSETLPQVVESAADMVVQVIDGVLSSCKDAIEYITENI